MAKGEIACFEQFLPLSLGFQKLSAAEASKSVNMRERVNVQFRTEYIGYSPSIKKSHLMT